MKKIYLFIILVAFSYDIYSQKEFWGTVSSSGEFGYGYIFRTDSTGDNFTIVHHFTGEGGYNPGAMIALANNKLYGVTTSGGVGAIGIDRVHDSGVLYEYDMTTGTFTILQNFGPDNTEIDGSMPMGDGRQSLTEVSPGVIWGEIRGASAGGKIFSYNTVTDEISTVAILPTFTGGSDASIWSMRLTGKLYKHTDGYLYGSTMENSTCPIGMPLGGSIVRVNLSNNTVTLPYLAPCNDALTSGYRYKSNFTVYNNDLYSTAILGATANKGVLYSYNPVTGIYTKKHDFEGGQMGWLSNSQMELVEVNGKLYGFANGGTPEPNLPGGGGILFEFDSASNIFSKKYDFLLASSFYMEVGPHPMTLIKGHNNKLYGTARNGIFEYDPVSNDVMPKGRFSILYQTPSNASITSVCRKPSYLPAVQTSFTVCHGNAFSHSLTSSNSESVIWFHNDMPDASQTNTTLSFGEITEGNAGTWKAILANECGTTETQTFTINVVSQPVINLSGNAIETPAIADSYQWMDCDTSLAIDGSETASFIPAEDGNYAVTITTGSCSITSECYEYSTMGLDNLTFPDILLYPNPAVNVIWIQTGNELPAGTIYNTMGQEVMNVSSGKTDIRELPQGTYFVAMISEAGILRAKFIKQ